MYLYIVKRRNIKILVLFFAITLLGVSCKKKEQYPPEPIISFVSFTNIQNSSGIDDKGVLKISFTDGDGDIGLRQEDTIYPFEPSGKYYYDFFIKYFEKQKGVYKEIIIDSNLTFNARLPYLEPNNDNPNIKGEIEIELFVNNPISVYDTIKFEATICDRILNMSNTVSTPDIIVKKHN